MLPFDSQAKKFLSSLLDPKSETGRTMRLDETQAFMLALLSGPDKTEPHIWLPEVLGEEEQFSRNEIEEIQMLVLRLAFDLKKRLDAGELPVLLLYDDEYGKSDFYTWCNAYLYALDVVKTDWFEKAADDDFEDLFYPVMALAGMYDDYQDGQAVLNLTDEDMTQLEGELPYALREIYNYWHKRG
ncbi:MAG: UPF0149 family protein [Neisseria sp.]|uniref:UPF0149 family protein n=1 Tax=Neisseria sp. TaxID=192066 RepID=UPI0026DC34E0|nr:UPF0149 family protein [Neisseria sp.]MDO4641553.1 UPF0149 family protein [Neisseria sp.]